MKLEDLRRDNIGDIVAWFRREPATKSTGMPLTFHDYCNTAFYLTCQSIEQLEKSKQIINQGNNNVLAVGMWFISIEAFINALLRIGCRIKKKDFHKYKKQDIGSRLSSLLEILEVQKNPFYKSGTFQRLEEFKTFRNEIFHDRTWESELVFHKTKFSPLPYASNQVDAMQGAVISIEVFHAFRNVYKGFDLMPDIVVRKEDSFGHKKLDILYRDLLQPFFAATLHKHNLTSDLIQNPTLVNLGPSRIVNKGDVGIIIKAVQDEKFKFAPNKQETSLGAGLLAKAADTIELNVRDNFSVGWLCN